MPGPTNTDACIEHLSEAEAALRKAADEVADPSKYGRTRLEIVIYELALHAQELKREVALLSFQQRERVS